MKPVIVLVTNSLRLDDHPALAAACETGAPVLPVFILDDAAPGKWKLGGASRWWLMKSLEVFSAALAGLGSRLILRQGDTVEVLEGLIEECGAGSVYLTRGYAPWVRDAEAKLQALCGGLGVELRRFSGNLLLEPEEVRTKTGGVYGVFSPFWRQCQQILPRDMAPLGRPTQIPAPDIWPASLALEDLPLAPRPAFWATPIAAVWEPGEAAAITRLGGFLDEVAEDYASARDVPGLDGTSRLSPSLAFGEISPRRIWQQAMERAKQHPQARAGIHAFLRELGWRDFSAHLLFHNPQMPESPLKGQFARFPWQSGDGEAPRAWQLGQTGFPIVDAGMRQLWQTGWMHNRVRMIVASFLVKDLLWHWRDGEAWFWDTLVDADIANNSASWQWVAGCGADAAPYFRIFNPVTQGERFDPGGDYIRRYVPELAGLPNDFIHKPFEAPALVLKAAGVELGTTYPKPVVDRARARKRALAALSSIKGLSA